MSGADLEYQRMLASANVLPEQAKGYDAARLEQMADIREAGGLVTRNELGLTSGDVVDVKKLDQTVNSGRLSETSLLASFTQKPTTDLGDWALLRRDTSDVSKGVAWTTADVLIARLLGWHVVEAGTGDNHAAWLSAYNAAVAAGGGVVYFAPGTWTMTATMTVSDNGITVKAAGRWKTTITRSTDYGDTLLFTGNDATGTLLTDTGLEGLSFKSTGLTTSGAHLHYNGVTRHTAHDLYFNDGFIGIKAAGLTASHLTNIYGVFTNLYGGTATGRRYMQFLSAAATYAHPSCGDLFIDQFNLRANTTNTVFQYGVEVQSADGIWFSNGHIGNTTAANLLLNAVDAAHPIGLLFFDQIMCDEGTGHGLKFAGSANTGRNINFTGCRFKGGSTGTNGIDAQGTTAFYDVTFSGCTVSEYVGHGVNLVANGLRNFTFDGCQVYGNSYGNPGGASGYTIADMRKIQITGGCSGGANVDPEGTPTQAYGINIGAGCTGVTITGVDLRGNTVKGLGINSASLPEVQAVNCRTDESSSVPSASTLTLPETGEVFTVTGTTTINNIQATWKNRRVVLRFSGVLSVPDGGNLKLNGPLTTAADTTLSLFFDGTNWIETGRSVN